MQTVITATTSTGFAQDFYSNIGIDKAEKVRQAEAFAGSGGKVRITQRERLNDYVGPPRWSERRFVEQYMVQS